MLISPPEFWNPLWRYGFKIQEERSCATRHPRTRDFTTGSPSFGLRNIATRFCMVQCGNGSAKSSSRPATKCASILCVGSWQEIMSTCFCRSHPDCRCQMWCSGSKEARRAASGWSSLNCASATGAGDIGHGGISRLPREMSRMILSCSTWNYIPLNDATGLSR